MMVHWKEHIVVLLLILVIAGFFLLFDSNITNLIDGNEITGYAIADNSNISITLDLPDVFPPDKVLTGNVFLSYDNIDYETPIKIYVDDKQKFSGKIGDLLDDNNLEYESDSGVYEVVGSALTSISTNDVVAIKLSDFVKPGFASMKLSGNSNFVELDVGVDKELNWRYQGNFSGYGDHIFPEGADPDIELTQTTEILFGGNTNQKCEDIFVDFDELYPTSEININTFTKIGNDYSGIPYLTASIFGLGNCQPEPEPESTLTLSSCSLPINNPLSDFYQVCIFTSAGANSLQYYEVPVVDLIEGPYYFITLQKAAFSTQFNGEITLQGNSFEQSINDFISLNCPLGVDCVIPLKFNVSSPITLSDLSLVGQNDRIHREFFDVEFTQPILKNGVDIPFELFDIDSPDEIYDSHEIRFEIGENEATKIFSVKEIPSANFIIDTNKLNILSNILFDASSSTASGNNDIVSYNWDFGDGTITTSTIPFVSHIYTTLGTKIVELQVIDNLNQISPVYRRNITISFDSSLINSVLNQTKFSINNSRNYFTFDASSAVQDTYLLLGFEKKLSDAEIELETIQRQYDSILVSGTLSQEEKDAQLESLVEKLIILYDEVPVSMTVEEIIFDQLVDFSEIPNPNLFRQGIAEKTNYEIEIFEFQDEVNVRSFGRKVNVNYLSSQSDSFRLVKKEITTGANPVSIAELVPSTIKEVLTSGSSMLSPAIIQFPGGTKEIVYTLEDGLLQELSSAKTIAIPDLSNVDEGILRPTCGNLICEVNGQQGFDEKDSTSEYFCPTDCEKDRNYFLLILIVIIAALGIYYINFYKGPYNFREVTNKIAIKLFHKRIFTSQRDLANLKAYVKTAFQRGYTVKQITKVLLGKGWKQDHINYVVKSLKKKK